MKILFLTQWFDPEPTPKGLEFVKKLISLGHEVDVLTSIPNYPLGKYYPGYKFSFIQKEIMDDVSIYRVPIYPSHDSSSIKRFFTYFTFCLSSLFFGFFLSKKADLIYAYHPPNVGFIASCICKIRKIPLVHDVQDIWPDTFLSTGMIQNKILLRLLSKFSNWVYSQADSLIVISDGFKNLLVDRGLPEEKINLVCNWSEEQKLAEAQELQNNPIKGNKKFNFLFAGNMGAAQNLHLLLKAAKEVMAHSSDIQFNFVGDGLELATLKEYSAKHNLKNVLFIPRVSMNEVGSFLLSADVLVVHLKSDPLFEITVPSKIQAYLFVGKPILSNVPGDAAKIIENASAGFTSRSGSVSSLVDSINKFHTISRNELEAMGKRGKNYYQKNLSLNTGTLRTDSIFRKLIK